MILIKLEKAQYFFKATFLSTRSNIILLKLTNFSKFVIHNKYIRKPLLTTGGIEINDKIRAFKGDHPASQFEAGQQARGNYACLGCCINYNCLKKST